MKAPSQLLELFKREFEVGADALEQRFCRRWVLAQALLGHPQMQRECDEALLSAVVQIALESSALRDTRLYDPRPRGRQLIVRLSALERERDELREVGKSLLCLGRK